MAQLLLGSLNNWLSNWVTNRRSLLHSLVRRLSCGGIWVIRITASLLSSSNIIHSFVLGWSKVMLPLLSGRVVLIKLLIYRTLGHLFYCRLIFDRAGSFAWALLSFSWGSLTALFWWRDARSHTSSSCALCWAHLTLLTLDALLFGGGYFAHVFRILTVGRLIASSCGGCRSGLCSHTWSNSRALRELFINILLLFLHDCSTGHIDVHGFRVVMDCVLGLLISLRLIDWLLHLHLESLILWLLLLYQVTLRLTLAAEHLLKLLISVQSVWCSLERRVVGYGRSHLSTLCKLVT